MGNRRLMVFFAGIFSILFSLLYYFLFTMTLDAPTNEKRVLYMNQVGLYEKEESVKKMEESLTSAGIKSYELKQKNLTAVVCSISKSEKDLKEDQAKLAKMNNSYLVKKVTVQDAKIIKLIDDSQYAQALERIGK